jgi:ribosomal protein S10
MNAKRIKEVKEIGAQQIISLDTPAPTPRQRLNANIERLLSLDKQLYKENLEQVEILTAIQLVAFKVQHLAWQIQNDERLGPEM